jgi:hypothetical protein
MTTATEARPTVTSPLLKLNGTRLDESQNRTVEISNALRRSGAGLPMRDCQAGFQSRI